MSNKTLPRANKNNVGRFADALKNAAHIAANRVRNRIAAHTLRPTVSSPFRFRCILYHTDTVLKRKTPPKAAGTSFYFNREWMCIFLSSFKKGCFRGVRDFSFIFFQHIVAYVWQTISAK